MGQLVDSQGCEGYLGFIVELHFVYWGSMVSHLDLNYSFDVQLLNIMTNRSGYAITMHLAYVIAFVDLQHKNGIERGTFAYVELNVLQANAMLILFEADYACETAQLHRPYQLVVKTRGENTLEPYLHIPLEHLE